MAVKFTLSESSWYGVRRMADEQTRKALGEAADPDMKHHSSKIEADVKVSADV